MLVRGFSSDSRGLLRTALHSRHTGSGGRMVDFSGWELPVQYSGMGIVQSVHHTRSAASLFDVSHMQQLRIEGPGRTQFLDKVLVSSVSALKSGQGRYSLMANEGGGIVDDVVVTNRDDWFHLIANAGCREKDLAHLRQQLAKFSEEHGQHAAQIVPLEDRALLALQGPMAAETVQKLVGSNVDLAKLFFFYSAEMEIAGVPCLVSRSGYTGEDGFEISVHNEKAGELADALLENSCVQWAGLGARDTLRLEAGLCLYGHDLDDTTTPVEAGLLWTIGPKRRKEGGFVGADAILKQMEEGAAVQRVGLLIQGAPAREQSDIKDQNGNDVGAVSSGTFSPTLKAPIAMGYVKRECAKIGTKLKTVVRGKESEAEVVQLPFVPHRYFLKPKAQ